MKPIKFKVWCEFEIDGEIQTSMESPASWFLLTQGGKLWSYDPITSPKPLEKEYKKAIPLFYTGLKDKNGKEIYEGDVVEQKIEGYTEQLLIYWDDEVAGFVLDGLLFHESFSPDKFKIIGNIYENEGLLEEK